MESPRTTPDPTRGAGRLRELAALFLQLGATSFGGPAAHIAIMGLEPGEPMPDFSQFSAERLRLLRQGNFFDALPLHLLTRASLATLARLAPETVWDPRRFRMNALLDADGGGYPEMDWIGRRVRVGTAVLAVAVGCPRCVMVTQQVDDVPQDHRVMRTLVRETHHLAGVYASIEAEGEIRCGDPIERL